MNKLIYASEAETALAALMSKDKCGEEDIADMAAAEMCADVIMTVREVPTARAVPLDELIERYVDMVKSHEPTPEENVSQSAEERAYFHGYSAGFLAAQIIARDIEQKHRIEQEGTPFPETPAQSCPEKTEKPEKEPELDVKSEEPGKPRNQKAR